MKKVMMDMGMNPNGLSLRYGLFGAEPWSEAMRVEINERLGIRATDNYGLSEIMWPCVAGECQECNGLHINEDHFLVEVVESIFFDAMKKQRALVDTIKKRLASVLGIGVAAKLVEERTLERFDAKGSRVIGNNRTFQNPPARYLGLCHY